MEFQSVGEIMKVEEKKFTNDRGEEVKYVKARYLTDDGEIVNVTATSKVLDEIGEETKVKVRATFSVSADFKQNAKLRLEEVERA